jgi:DNA-binding NarL/FixJ family response regulator
MAAGADGTVLLAEGDPRAALGSLRRAAAFWFDLDAPYELARVRLCIALALRQIGDVETAELERDAARRVFEGLGAIPDVRRVDAIGGGPGVQADGLSTREIEVLRLLAHGMTNRTIAGDLGISERTVDRHVSNIFVKLDVSSRSAATAYAFEHGLV